MKFKINKLQVENLIKKFDKENQFEEIELEPVWENVREAMVHQEIGNEWWHRGYHYGFREGYYTAKNEIPHSLFCGDVNCKYKF